MGIERTPEELTVIRHKYEHTDQPVEEIARDHRMSSRTLHAWARRWNWTPRHAPLPAEGPPPTPPPPSASAAPLLLPAQGLPLVPAQAAMNDAPDSAPLAPQTDAAALPPMPAGDAMPAGGAEPACDPDTPTARRLQNAVAGVLAALTRTLREFNTLQGQYEEPVTDDSPADIDEFRRALARKIDAFVAAQGGGVRDDAEPEGA
jgi:hypothetical protein